MPIIAAQIAPQRSTQYMMLSNALAPSELRLSPLGEHLTALESVKLGGVDYLKLTLDAELDDRARAELGMLAFTSAFFEYFDALDDQPGPLLRPFDTAFVPFMPPELTEARRYRGKTSEQFTHFLLNIARHSSAFATQPWDALRVLDPLMGGGTTLFAALVLGAHAFGIEQTEKDVQTTAGYLKGFAIERVIACKLKLERLKGAGKRWWFTVGKGEPRICGMARGDTLRAPELLIGFKKPHLIVTDLPYGVQHRGGPVDLLREALPVWVNLLMPGGALVFSWDATRLPHAQVADLIKAETSLSVRREPPYDALGHRVDRVIKRREVLVAVKPDEAE